jgi:GAF domain-containing protein
LKTPAEVLLDQTVSLVAARTSGSYALLEREGLSHTVAMRIPGGSRPYGSLIIGARHERTYSREDLFFSHTVANALGAAVERAAMDHDLRRELALYSATVEAAADGIVVTDETWTRHDARRAMRDRDVESAADVLASESVEA